jgi:hypothetical protein
MTLMEQPAMDNSSLGFFTAIAFKKFIIAQADSMGSEEAGPGTACAADAEISEGDDFDCHRLEELDLTEFSTEPALNERAQVPVLRENESIQQNRTGRSNRGRGEISRNGKDTLGGKSQHCRQLTLHNQRSHSNLEYSLLKIFQRDLFIHPPFIFI